MTDTAQKLRNIAFLLDDRDGSFIPKEIRRAADELERLAAENQDLREMLLDYYLQNRCGCKHPACKRCVDDRFVEEIIEANPKPAKEGEQ